jgi:hypothetical protein
MQQTGVSSGSMVKGTPAALIKLGDSGLEVLDLKGNGGTHGRLGGGLPKLQMASVLAPMSASDQKPVR